MPFIQVDVPDKMHAIFKAICAIEGVKMQEKLLGMIEDYTRSHLNLLTGAAMDKGKPKK